jgi:hypothetical protein
MVKLGRKQAKPHAQVQGGRHMAVFETAYSGRNCNWKILESGVEETKIGATRTSDDETGIGGPAPTFALRGFRLR